MSISDTVDEKYRIHAADLDGRPHRLVISNISYQGVEEMLPVLHFEGLNKRLVLNQPQSFDMIRITHTPLPADWIGETIILKPARVGGDATIEILSPLQNPSLFSLARWRTRIGRTDNFHVSGARKVGAAILIVAVCAVALWLSILYKDALPLLLQEWLPW